MAKMPKYLPKIDNDSTHYNTLGSSFRSGIESARKTLSGINERVDRAVEKPFLNVYKKISNNPASNKWVGRHKGDLLEIAAILGFSALTGYAAGKAADAVIWDPDPSAAGRHIINQGQPFVLKEIITVVNSEHPLGYTFPHDIPENIGKNKR
jgi:hypothetical protein